MPHQNRVDPFGEIVAAPQRGRWMGNRGILHEGTTIVRPWQHNHWIICETSYKGWWAPQWSPHRYTPLFFLDEAVALAAGHRPCALCRRAAYDAFVAAWPLSGERRDAIDRRLHRERRGDAHRRPWRELPVGAFAFLDGAPVRVDEEAVVPWTPAGYVASLSRPNRGDAAVLTPSSTVDALSAGYRCS
ncbi:MAG TPA: hypothetical protein VFB78_08535 [Acidimicrobiales bacterium]|nr:hypothetical protein [Acidimicrobiales bacterium]